MGKKNRKFLKPSEGFNGKYNYNSSQAIDNHKPISASQKRNRKPRKGRQNVDSVIVDVLEDSPYVHMVN